MKTKSMNKGMMVLLFVTMFVVVLNGIADAATIEVKQLGCGTQTDCYTKISDAIFYAQQDDTIKVYPGRYEEAVVINKNLTLIGSGPQVTMIYSSTTGITVNQFIKATVIGFTITASNNGIYIDRDTDTIFRNNIVVGNGGRGILFTGSDTTLSATIINNVISYNASNGIEARSCCGQNEKLYVHNNIISNNGANGINWYYITGINSYNNIYANLSGNYVGTGAGTGDISQNPLFIDPSNGNYVLQSTSPSKNAGRTGSADNDPDGTRNDMGAYGGPDATGFWPYPPGAPIITNLTVTPTTVQKGGNITINATGEIR